jgi:hypothetical protein
MTTFQNENNQALTSKTKKDDRYSYFIFMSKAVGLVPKINYTQPPVMVAGIIMKPVSFIYKNCLSTVP